MAKHTGKDRPQPPRGWRPEDADNRPAQPRQSPGQRPGVGREQPAQRGARSLPPEDRLALRHGRQALYGFHSVAEAIANPRDLAVTISGLKPEEAARMSILRDGKAQDVKVVIGDMPRDRTAAAGWHQ